MKLLGLTWFVGLRVLQQNPQETLKLFTCLSLLEHLFHSVLGGAWGLIFYKYDLGDSYVQPVLRNITLDPHLQFWDSTFMDQDPFN